MCPKCKDWGETIQDTYDQYTVKCPDCNRCTYINLGVNCPAGMAVALSAGHAIRMTAIVEKARQMGRSEVVAGIILDGQARYNAWQLMMNGVPYKFKHYPWIGDIYERGPRSEFGDTEETGVRPGDGSHIRIVSPDVEKDVRKPKS